MPSGRAAALTVGVVLVAYAGLGLVPQYLVTTLSGRVASVVRDLIVVAWELVALAVAMWVLVRAQHSEAGR